jgi:hypothetical protein
MGYRSSLFAPIVPLTVDRPGLRPPISPAGRAIGGLIITMFYWRVFLPGRALSSLFWRGNHG